MQIYLASMLKRYSFFFNQNPSLHGQLVSETWCRLAVKNAAPNCPVFVGKLPVALDQVVFESAPVSAPVRPLVHPLPVVQVVLEPTLVNGAARVSGQPLAFHPVVHPFPLVDDPVFFVGVFSHPASDYGVVLCHSELSFVDVTVSENELAWKNIKLCFA